MPFGHADELVALAAGLVGEDEGRDPGRVGLEGERQDVEHQADVLAIVLGDARRTRHALQVDLDRLVAPVHPAFQLADRGQVFVHLLAVGLAEPALELPGVLGDEVEDALAVLLPLRAGLGRFVGHSPPKSRSKAAFGLTSLAIGVDSDRQEMFDE